MSITLGDLTAAVGGRLVGGAPALAVTAAATLETVSARGITLVDSPDKLHLLAKSAAAAAIVPAGSGPLDRPTIEVGDVHAAFATVIQQFRPPRDAAPQPCPTTTPTPPPQRKSSSDSGKSSPERRVSFKLEACTTPCHTQRSTSSPLPVPDL